MKTLAEHQGAVTAVQVDYVKIVSTSKDANVRVWDLRTGQPMYIFPDHSMGINCMRFVDDLMVSAGDDQLVTVWKF